MDECQQLIREYFQRRLGEWGDNSPLHHEASQLAAGVLDPGERRGLDSVQSFEQEPSVRGAELDLLVGFVDDGIERRVAMPLLSLAMVHLKRYFSVDEGEFVDARPREVARLIGERLDAILADGVIDQPEDLEQVELQQIFDLSYDDYLALGCPAIERAYQNLDRGIDPRTNDAPGARARKMALLLPPYNLAQAQRGTLGG